MMRRKGVNGVVDRFKEMSRRNQLILGGSAVGVLLLIVVVVVLASGGGGAVDPAGDDSDLVVNFSDSAGDAGVPSGGDPLLRAPLSGDPLSGDPAALDSSPPGMTVEEQVAATVAALTPPTPTPTPIPTPDIAATVQAEVDERLSAVSPVVSRNPLDAGTIQSPQLTEAEKRYFAAMGNDLWVGTQMYMRLSEVGTAEFPSWSSGYLRDRLGFIEGLLASVPEDPRDIPRSELGDVVVSYVEFIDRGIRSLQLAVNELKGAVRVFEEAGVEYVDEVEAGDRDQLRQHYLSINGLLLDFYSVMSAYGCSACGELFRTPFVLEQ